MTAATAAPAETPRDAARRRRLAPVIVAALAAGIVGAYLLVWVNLSRTDQTGSDYSTFHVAALLWREGHADQLYDQKAEIARHEQLVPPSYHVDLPFISPPTTVLLTAPLTPLDLGTAFRVASLLELLLAGGAVLVTIRAAPRVAGRLPAETAATALAALAGVGSLVLLLMGQWDGLCALGLALAYAAWRHDRPALAGLALALTFAPTKPHLAVGLAAFVLGTRRLPAIAGAAAGVATTLAAGLVVDGVRGWGDWLGSLSLSSSHSPLASLLGFTGFFGSWTGDGGAARAAAAVATLVAVVGCVVLGSRVRRDRAALEPALAGATALSLVAAPHLLMHDLVVLAPVAAWMLCWAAQWGARAHARVMVAWVVLNAACLLDLGNSASAPPGRLVPVALSAVGWAAVVVTQRRRGSTVGAPVRG